MHAFAALDQLKSEAHGGLAKNFDLLLDIAETGGDMIISGLVKPVQRSSSEEEQQRERQRIDKLIDFLYVQLHKEKPSLSPDGIVGGLGWTVGTASGFGDKWPPSEDPNQLPVPYANDRVVAILMECLDHSDPRMREAAIHWLGVIGANDLAKTADVEAALNAQVAKEEGFAEKGPPEKREKTIALMKRVIADSLRKLRLERDMRTQKVNLEGRPVRPPEERPTRRSGGSE